MQQEIKSSEMSVLELQALVNACQLYIERHPNDDYGIEKCNRAIERINQVLATRAIELRIHEHGKVFFAEESNFNNDFNP